ncbi:MAG: PBP1A family penicillin-binding protein [Candidatus Rokubacteria bacterium]|nr:PBP1A family penicillin-binding protein [Candidatus Rokubacteria bacterium]
MPRRARSGRTRRLLEWAVFLAGLATMATVGTAIAAFALLPRDLPSVQALEEYAPSLGTKVYADDDGLIIEFQAERRIFVPLAQIPKSLQRAIIAVEDTRFYSHFGLDPRGIARALWANFRQGRIAEGGSTITQQLAKVLFLTPDRSWSRKLKEAVLAFELERRYSKDRILELYLNHIYLGHGAFGVEAASRTYFGKSVNELGLPQTALLAALPRAPGSYSPFERSELARRRRAHVLHRMVELGYLSEAEAKRANKAPLGLVPKERRRTTGQYFVEHLRQLLEEKFGTEMVYKGGLHVYTTLNSSLQLAAELSLREGLKALEARRQTRVAGRTGAAEEVHPEGAVVVLEPQTGYVKAMVGGFDFARSEFNRALYARRQPGSAFKPFVYIAALEAGRTPADFVEDSPVSYPGRNDRAWEPENYDGTFRGPITLQQALEESVNVATVKVLEQVGVPRTIEVARRLGITSPLTGDLTLALGSSEVSLLELTAAYGALANQGIRMDPLAIRYITDAQGKLLEEQIPQGREALSPPIAYVITEMLRGAVTRGTAVGARALGRPIAAKTGTTNDFSNAWFVGYTPSLVAGVWVGYDRPRSLGADETGARAALPIWLGIMRRALEGVPAEDFPIPDRVVRVTVDLDTGYLATRACPRPVLMAFVAGTEPTRFCPVHFGGPPGLFDWLFPPR